MDTNQSEFSMFADHISNVTANILCTIEVTTTGMTIAVRDQVEGRYKVIVRLEPDHTFFEVKSEFQNFNDPLGNLSIKWKVPIPDHFELCDIKDELELLFIEGKSVVEVSRNPGEIIS